MIRIILIISTALVAFSGAQVTGLAGWDIFVDPGHSQNENMGIYNYPEARKNLGVALNLRDMLMTMTDIDTVVLSRTNSNQQVSLSDRTYHANSIGASWFHSLHSDASSMGSPANSTLMLWGQYSNGLEKVPNGGNAMSDIMIANLTRGMRTYTVYGSIGDCSFYGCSGSGPYLHVNRVSAMPSELSESGFHTNPRQNQLNMNAEWKRLEAWTFYWSILQFHGIARPAVGIAAGVIEDEENGEAINGATATLNGQSYTTDTFESLFSQYSTDPNQLRNGFYYFEGLPNTELELIVNAEHYYPDTQAVVISDSFFTFTDFSLVSSRAPFITGTTPMEGDSAYPTIDDIIINFSREMDPLSVEAAFSISPASPGTFHWTNSHRRLIYRPDLLDYETDYTVTVSDSAHDIYNHYLDGNNDEVAGGNFVLQFTSSAMDIYPPEIVSVYPGGSSNNVELNPVVSILYNEILEPDSAINANVRLERYADHSDVDIITEHYRVNQRSVINLFPEYLLEGGEIYVTRLGPGITDIAGNPTGVFRSYSFSTTNRTLNITGIDNFNAGLESNWAAAGYSGSNVGNLIGINRGENSAVVNHSTGSTKSMEIQYDWDIASTQWLLRIYLQGGSPRSVIFDASYRLQAYVFGDGSGNKIRLAIDEGTSTSWPGHEATAWVTIDWYGWKLVEWDLSDPVDLGSWIGNGMMDGARYRFDSIQLTYEPGNEASGSILVDDLRLVKDGSLGTDKDKSGIPSGLSLSQNYPNPFNPSTLIKYAIDEAGKVNLSIYDISGRFINSIVNSHQPAGTHELTWDGKDSRGIRQSSGIYIYRLTAGNRTLSRQMILMK